jgi:MFS family permease
MGVTGSLAAPAEARQRRARGATTAAFVAQGLMFTALLTHLPQFTDRYSISEGTVTLIVLMVTVLAGVGSLLSEVLAAATSSRTALRCGLLVIAGAGAVIGLAPGLGWFVAGFAVYAIGLGAVDAAGNMQAVAVQHRYGRSIITSFHAAWSAAAIIGALYVAGGEQLSVPLPGSILPVAVIVLLIAVIAGPRLLAREESVPWPPPRSRPSRSPAASCSCSGWR